MDPLRIILNKNVSNLPTHIEFRENKFFNVFHEENVSSINGSTDILNSVNCALTLHRDDCSNARIKPIDKIGWNTRICFKWSCLNLSKLQD